MTDNIPFIADLHCHSTASDGTLSPVDLVKRAISLHLSGLSITDHDTVDAYHEALPFAKEQSFPLLLGAEFTSLFDDQSIHLLAYAFQMDHPNIINLVQRQKLRREERNRAVLKQLEEKGFPLDYEELIPSKDNGVLGRPHIAAAMIRRGYVKNVREAFDKYLGDNKSCYVLSSAPTAEEVVSKIHEANGFIFIAHPHLIKKRRTLNNLLKLPFDGIEGRYAKMPPSRNKGYIQIAKERRWMICGGSDFHGERAYPVALGDSWTEEETFKKLYQRFAENNSQWQIT
jgi:predicted metal-dependent phosphoesterase TrpH